MIITNYNNHQSDYNCVWEESRDEGVDHCRVTRQACENIGPQPATVAEHEEEQHNVLGHEEWVLEVGGEGVATARRVAEANREPENIEKLSF